MSFKSDGICLSVQGSLWRLYVQSVTRIREDWFIQFTALGPRSCTVIVRSDQPGLGRSAADLFDRIRDALAGTLRPCVFLDLLAD